MSIKYVAIVAVIFSAFLSDSSSHAGEYQGEVMTLKGTAQLTREGSTEKAPLKEGDLLNAGDLVEVGAASHVDVAYDKAWDNITRFGENSKTEILAIFPTGLKLDHGNLYAKLGKMPKGTTFEVRTPTAVAAARGTEFLVQVDEKGATEVLGFENKVEVFSLDANGNLGQNVVLDGAQKTEVGSVNEPPSPPEKVDETEFKQVEAMSGEVDRSADELEKEGREGKIQSVGSVDAANTLTDFYVPRDDRAGSDRAPVPGTDAPPLKDEQLAALRDQFIEMGGDPADFDKFKDQFTAVDPNTFDQMHDRFESGDYSPTNPPPDGSAGGYDSTRAPYEGGTTGEKYGDYPSGSDRTDKMGPDGPNGPDGPPDGPGGPGGSSGPDMPNMEPPAGYEPPNMDTIQQNMDQIQTSVERTVENSTNMPPPPPPDDPCLVDPVNCHGSTTGG